MQPLLPVVSNRAEYKTLYPKDEVWRPAIYFLITKHQLQGPVQRGSLGSHIVYRVGAVWIKLMAPIFAEDMPFEISGLRTVENRLSVSTPNLRAKGDIEGWPYVILGHVDGEPIRSAWSGLTLEAQLDLAKQIAEVTRELARCPFNETIANRFSWNKFVEKQFEQCEEQQKQKGLPPPWLENVRGFLSGFDISEFQTNEPVFLHADLTFDHFLIGGEDRSKILGVIDLADCQIGHREYEYVAPAIFIFKAQSRVLNHFFTACGVRAEHLNERYSEKLLAWSILHRYFSFISYFQKEMNACAPGDFVALARQVFPLSLNEEANLEAHDTGRVGVSKRFSGQT